MDHLEHEINSTNCESCGFEDVENNFKTVKVANLKKPLRLCNKCLLNDPEQSFQHAAEILQEIMKIASSNKSDYENRLKMIKSILGVNEIF